MKTPGIADGPPACQRRGSDPVLQFSVPIVPRGGNAQPSNVTFVQNSRGSGLSATLTTAQPSVSQGNRVRGSRSPRGGRGPGVTRVEMLGETGSVLVDAEPWLRCSAWGRGKRIHGHLYVTSDTVFHRTAVDITQSTELLRELGDMLPTPTPGPPPELTFMAIPMQLLPHPQGVKRLPDLRRLASVFLSLLQDSTLALPLRFP